MTFEHADRGEGLSYASTSPADLQQGIHSDIQPDSGSNRIRMWLNLVHSWDAISAIAPEERLDPITSHKGNWKTGDSLLL